MDIGIPAPNITKPLGSDALRRIALVSENLGFHSLWLGDHIVYPSSAPVQDGDRYTWDLYEAFTTAGFLAAITSRIRIAFGVLVLTYRNPILTAKMTATLDQLSNGRVILGIGPGYLDKEFQALGIPRRDTGARTDEYLEAFRTLWASDRPAFHGTFVNIDNVYMRPSPVQDRLPIWIGGMSDAALQRAARYGDGWHTPRLTVEAMKPLIEKLTELTIAAGRSPADIRLSNRPAVRFAEKVNDPVALAKMNTVSRVTADRPGIVGPPAYVAEQIARFEVEIGVDHLVLDLHEGDTVDEVVRAIEILHDRVVPLLPNAKG